uniref:Uncharacterized protein n=1 Tax=Anguilla anguilla TaxID=7936 RepID=A0A0E9WWA5_ANGAN
MCHIPTVCNTGLRTDLSLLAPGRYNDDIAEALLHNQLAKEILLWPHVQTWPSCLLRAYNRGTRHCSNSKMWRVWM